MNKSINIPYRRCNNNNRLTTKENNHDEQPKIRQHPLRHAADKFRARPGTYLIIPCVAALVGWVTNWMAVQMIFYPIQFRGIPLYIRKEVPLGFLGWQGIVPCKTRPMSEAMVDMVTSQLLSLEEAFGRLSPKRIAKLLAPEVPELGQEVARSLLPKWVAGVPKSVFLGLDTSSKAIIAHMNYRFLKDFAVAMQENIGSLFNIRNCVVSQMLEDRTLLGQLFKKCGQKELDFLTNSGLWFGFLLGLIQMVVALFWDNPWSLSIGGGVVGYATNWLALKWIFEPVNPTKIGPWVLQGQFLRRQKEVSAEFSKFFATKVLTSEKVWHSILTDPETTPAFHSLFRQHFTKFVNKVTNALRINPGPEIVAVAASEAITKLPSHVGVLHDYVDKTLGLQEILRVRMEHMTSSQFERVLHPIFEEDELTLILAGAVLGFAAGLIQQGFATGKIQLPKVKDVVKSVKQYASHPRQSTKAAADAAKTRISNASKRVQNRLRHPGQTAKDVIKATKSRLSSIANKIPPIRIQIGDPDSATIGKGALTVESVQDDTGSEANPNGTDEMEFPNPDTDEMEFPNPDTDEMKFPKPDTDEMEFSDPDTEEAKDDDYSS